MRIFTAAGILVLAASSTLGAQATPEGPRAGAWGTEVSFDGASGLGAAILRFRNDRTAWLLGFGALVDYRDPPLTPRTTTSVSGRLGMRSFRVPGSVVRPTIGAGVSAAFLRTSGGDQKNWQAGAYGELGISRFFGQSFAAGMTSDIHARYMETTSPSGGTSTIRVDIDAVRLIATIVF